MKNITRPKLSAGIFIFLLFLPLFGAAYAPIPPGAARNAGNAGISTCPMFPDNNFWNVPVADLPVHAQSSEWINSIGASQSFHMDFGSGVWDDGAIGIPYNILSGASSAFYTFTFDYDDESDAGPYPLPLSPKIEWGGDHHILTVDTDDCALYEVYDARKISGVWYGGSGAIWDLNSNAMRPDAWTSADAAGLPILPGLARYDEVAAGVIAHALRFTANCTAAYHIWPARHTAQRGSCANPIPFGARFRLKADYDISGYSPDAQVLLQAFKTYGIVLADNGSNWYVSGAPSESWDNDVLHELDALHGNNFEAVDTSGLMVDADSAETNYNLPGAFSKTAPANSALKVALTPTLSWAASANAASYDYCIVPAEDGACDDGDWIDNDVSTSVTLVTPLSLGSAYLWQVRAVNATGTRYANQAYWSFITGNMPGAFSKINPLNNAENQTLSPTLNWSASAEAAQYEYCYNTTGAPCAQWLDAGASRSASLRGLLPATVYYWQARAVNAFGPTEANGNWHTFTTAPLDSKTVYSNAAQDGWLLESSETSNVANQASSAGKLQVGDNRQKRQFRSLLSFDTAPMPDKAVISKVTLRIYKSAATIPDPFTLLGDLVADIKKGSFGANPALALGDFNIAGEAVGKFSSSDGYWYQLYLSPLNFKYVNLSGFTQFRIRFIRDDNNNLIQDLVQFHSGGDANKPQLIIEYTTP